ncbi:MAG TPA: hypothetical protein VF017_10185 [Thermoanaerobaculia bacterium]|nr:hypothetical protein [Thermoanaerobaculia bacterium]
MKKTMLVVGLLALGLAGPAAAQEPGGGALRESGGFSLDVAVANVGIDQFDQNRLGVGVIPRWCWFQGRWCWWLDIWWIDGPWRDPWKRRILFEDLLIPLGELEVGPGFMVAPALEYTWNSEGRLRPSVYAGFGLQRDEGQTTTVPGAGRFETSNVTSPVAIFGLGLTYDLSARTALRLTVGGSRLFTDDLEVRDPNGQVTTFEGGDMTSGIVSVGLNFGF